MRNRGRSGRWAGAVVMAASAMMAVPMGDRRGATAAATEAAPPQPATQPARVDDGSPGWRPGRSGWRGGPLNPADRSEAMLFLSQHAPTYYQTITALPEGSEPRLHMESVVGRAYVSYRPFKDEDPTLFGVITRRVEVEDAILRLGAKARATPADAAARADLRKQVVDWFNLNLQERQLRLDRLERTLKRERERLAGDSDARSRLIDERMARVLAAPGDGPFHGEGGRGTAGDEAEPDTGRGPRR